MHKEIYKITLLFNSNNVYGREIIEGIGQYIQSTQCLWDVYLEDDFKIRPENIEHWSGDGIIADFDEPGIKEMLDGMDRPIIGIGEKKDDYPEIPFVTTDHHSLMQTAFEHLKDKGIESFAFYGLPEHKTKKWAVERESIFKDIMAQHNYEWTSLTGFETSSETWQYSMDKLTEWLQSLPKGTGIISVTDARARHLLQACETAGIIVPDEISIIGIDNESLTRNLTRISLSSVGQSCRQMGYLTAKMLHMKIGGYPIRNTVTKIGADKVFERQSSDFRSVSDPLVIKARHYIRNNVKKGIKVYHVLEALRISRTNLEGRFKHELGYTMHHEIHKTRLQLACSLLANTELQISNLYNMCGYPSLQYMYSVFSKYLQMTPKEYRERHNPNFP